MSKTSESISFQRRCFLKLLGGTLLYAGSGGWQVDAKPSPPYRVGVGHASDPYGATLRAINATADWTPALVAGRRIVIKPNLVIGAAPDSGTVTDSEVVRAVIDLALQGGASEVQIVEAGIQQANFSACGYDFFNTYDPRVTLVDLANQPVVLANVPNGLAYQYIYLPALLFEPSTLLVSVAKLKVHNLAQVTLSMKNLFGLPPLAHYLTPGRTAGRYAMHDRSVNEAILDINRARPIDFAVVDGIWGMERIGPYGGDPVKMDLIVAGQNALAVDFICLTAMGLPLSRVQHLQYAWGLGLGPAQGSDIELRGDTFSPRRFLAPPTLPLVSYPRVNPPLFVPSLGETITFQFSLAQPGLVKVEIVLTDDTNPDLIVVRTLRDWTARPTGLDTLIWDGRDDNGMIVAPNRYGIRVTTKRYGGASLLNTIGWVRVGA